MPDLMELLLLVLVGGGVAALVATPFVRGRRGAAPSRGPAAEDSDVLRIRHRVALDAILDVEADHRAGSLDDAAYAQQRELAEQRAAETLAALEAAEAAEARTSSTAPMSASANQAPLPPRRVAAAALVVAVAVAIGFALPAPFSLANPTQTNEALASQRAQEAARQATIRQLLDQLTANPRDVDALSKLADAYLQGGTADDLSRAGTILLALISLEPTDASAYQRLITAYINVGDWTDAASATDAYAKVAPDSADIPFFRGIIALRGANDTATAMKEFQAFLDAAPDDPRAVMVRALLSEAESAAPSPSASPGSEVYPAASLASRRRSSPPLLPPIRARAALPRWRADRAGGRRGGIGGVEAGVRPPVRRQAGRRQADEVRPAVGRVAALADVARRAHRIEVVGHGGGRHAQGARKLRGRERPRS